MSEPQLKAPATADEARVLEIERTWQDLDDKALEAALTDLQNLATSSSLRYGYGVGLPRPAQSPHVAKVIDDQFIDAPAAEAQPSDPTTGLTPTEHALACRRAATMGWNSSEASTADKT